MISTYDYTLHKLIAGSDFLFVVPNYQRGYVWIEKEILQFLRDGLFCMERYGGPDEKYEHYAGQMIFRLISQERDGSRRIEIIDGQQRITTFMILVSVAVELMRAAGENAEKADMLRNKYLVSCSRFRCEEKKLHLLNKDSAFWNQLTDSCACNRQEIKLESQKKMWNAYQLINDFLMKKMMADGGEPIKYLEGFVEAVAESFRVVVLMTEDPGHEYALFQIVNDRGLPLTPGELLKARTMELLTSRQKEFGRLRLLTRAEEIWEDILSDTGSATEKYFIWNYTARFGHKPRSLRVCPINEQYEEEIFHCLNKREISMDHQDEILNELESIYTNIRLCRDLAKGIFPIAGASGEMTLLLGILICSMKNTLCIPLYLKLIRENKEKKAIKIAEMLTPMLIKAYFMARIMGNMNEEIIADAYKSIWEKLGEGNVDMNEIRQCLAAVLRKNNCREAFDLNINQPVYTRGSGNLITKFLLLMAELQCLKDQEKDSAYYGDDSVNIIFEQLSVEHILYEGIDESMVSRNFYESIHKIGNLTLLGQKLNGRERAKEFKDKKGCYSVSPYVITREVGKLDSWVYKDFEKRQKELIMILQRAFKL